MYSEMKSSLISIFIFSISLLQLSAEARVLSSQGAEQALRMRYHNGVVLSLPITVNLIWYGNFSSAQRAIVSDFFTSLTSSAARPSVSHWWFAIQKLYHLRSTGDSSKVPSLVLKSQRLESFSFGKSLKMRDIVRSASKGAERNSINVVVTSADVTVNGFCMSRCGTHGYSRLGRGRGRIPYIWVGNSETQCPGHCAWPFHRPIYGPQSPPLVAPNGDVGVDGMIINIASLLASTVTNPFGDGYFQGPAEAPLEAASACTGVYGKGAYPGFAGELLMDPVTGGSYNAHGVNGRSYLLPAIFDPMKSECWTVG